MNTALHAKFALACTLDERMAATARSGVAIAVAVSIADAARIAVAAYIASVARIAIIACLAVLVHAFALLVYFSGVLVHRALHLRNAAFYAQRPEGWHQRAGRPC